MSAHLYKLFLAACLLFAAGACLSQLLWRAAEGTDLLALVWEGRREEALDRRRAASRRIIEGKTRVVAELIAGRLTLLEATGRFRELQALVEDDDRGVIAPYWVVTGEEALCRTVLAWAEAELWHEPDQGAAAAVLARLNAEYRERFGRDPAEPGTVPPPAPPSWPSPAPAGPPPADPAGCAAARACCGGNPWRACSAPATMV